MLPERLADFEARQKQRMVVGGLRPQGPPLSRYRVFRFDSECLAQTYFQTWARNKSSRRVPDWTFWFAVAASLAEPHQRVRLAS